MNISEEEQSVCRNRNISEDLAACGNRKPPKSIGHPKHRDDDDIMPVNPTQLLPPSPKGSERKEQLESTFSRLSRSNLYF
jgi:hypothetical protein